MARPILYCSRNDPKVRPWLGMALSISLPFVLLLALSVLTGSPLAAMTNLQPTILPMVSITKSVVVQSVAPGQILVYTLTVTNTSTASYTQGLVVTDTIPANTVFENASMPVDGSMIFPDYHDTGTVTWTPNAQLAPSGTVQFQLKVLVAAGLRDGTPIVNNNYGVSEAQSGMVMGAPVTATVQAPVLTIVKEANNPQVCDGQRVGYTIRVTNTGHLVSSGPLTVTDHVPAGTIYVQSSPPGAFDAASGLITWTLLAPLAPAQSLPVSFTVTNPITTAYGTLLVNDAYTASAPDVPDTAIGLPVTVTAINTRVGFTSTAHAFTGQPVTFYNTSTGAINYYLWDLGDGSFLDTRPQPTHTYTQEGNFTVILTATGPCGTVAAQRQLTVTSVMVSLRKSASTSRIVPGEMLVYTLTVTNTSATSNTTTLIVTDTVPANTTFESAGFISPASGNISVPPTGGMGVVTWIPNVQLAPGGVMRLSLKVKVAANALPQSVIANDAYAVSEARSGVVTGEPVTTAVILPSSVTLVAVPLSLPVAHTATLTATVYDQNGLSVEGSQVNFSTEDALGLGEIVPSASTTDSNGRAKAVISSTAPGVKHVLAKTGSLSAAISVTFNVGVGEPYAVTLVADPASPWVTETARLTVTVADQAGHRMSGQLITFSSPNSFGTVLFSAIVPLTGTTDSNGQVTATVFSLLPGDKFIIATASNGVTGQTHVNFRGTHYIYLPLSMKHYRPAPSCAPEAWYTIGSEFNPVSLAYDAANRRLFVANRDGPNGGSLAVIQPDSGQLMAQVTGLPGAQGVAYDAAHNRILVAGGSTLYIVNGTTYTAMSVWLGPRVDAYSMAYNPANNKIYIASFRSNSITIVNAATFAITTLVDTRALPLNEPAYIAVNPNNNKVYVANHAAGRPVGFVTVIDGGTDAILSNVYLSGDLYGIAMDAPHNIVYVTSISAARVYAINAAIDQPLGDFQVVRTTDYMPVPLRMIAVNPGIATDTVHLWLTTSSGDWLNARRGLNRLLLISGRWTTYGPEMSQPHAAVVAPYPEDGILLDPGSRFVFAASAASNLVTVSQDNVALCPTLLAVSTNVEPLITVARTFRKGNLGR